MVKKLFDRIKNLERDLNNAVNTVRNIPSFLENAAKDTGNKFVDLIKPPIDEIDKCFGDLDDIIMDTVRELEKWPRTIGDGLRKVFLSIDRAFKDLAKFFDNLFHVCFDNDGDTICYGIDDMIEDFKRIVCMLETIPNRVDNIIVGIDNIFLELEIYLKLQKKQVEKLAKKYRLLLIITFYILVDG